MMNVLFLMMTLGMAVSLEQQAKIGAMCRAIRDHSEAANRNLATMSAEERKTIAKACARMSALLDNAKTNAERIYLPTYRFSAMLEIEKMDYLTERRDKTPFSKARSIAMELPNTDPKTDLLPLLKVKTAGEVKDDALFAKNRVTALCLIAMFETELGLDGSKDFATAKSELQQINGILSSKERLYDLELHSKTIEAIEMTTTVRYQMKFVAEALATPEAERSDRSEDFLRLQNLLKSTEQTIPSNRL